MRSLYIHLDSVDKVKTFVGIISAFDGEFDLGSNRYVVDAKSIMGIFSLDLGKTLRLDVHNEAILDNAVEALQEFIIS